MDGNIFVVYLWPMQEQNSYTLREFFEKFGVTQKKVAEVSGISFGMMRQYACGFKDPGDERLKMIQKAIRKIGKELKTVEIV